MIRINGYLIDCATEERLTYKATATKFPVEKGGAITDHIIVELPVLELECIVSDTPTGAVLVDASRQSLDETVVPSRDAFDFLTGLHQAQNKSGGGPVTVECTYGKFENMAITSLTPVRDVASLKALRFGITFEQIDIQETRRVTIRTAVPNATGKKNLGNQPALGWFGTDEAGIRYVISEPVRTRSINQRIYGPPILTTTQAQRAKTNSKDYFGGTDEAGDGLGQLDHFAVRNQAVPDGYVRKGEYYKLTKDQQRHIGDELTGAQYDHATGTWRAPGGQPVATKPPTDKKKWRRLTNGDEETGAQARDRDR